MKTTVSQRLMQAVADSELNYTEFGEKIGVVKQVVSAWKTGSRDVPDKYILKAIDLLDLDANYIIKGVESKKIDVASQEEVYKKQMELYEEAKKRADELLKAKDELMEMKDKIHQLSTNNVKAKKKETNSGA